MASEVRFRSAGPFSGPIGDAYLPDCGTHPLSRASPSLTLGRINRAMRDDRSSATTEFSRPRLDDDVLASPRVCMQLAQRSVLGAGPGRARHDCGHAIRRRLPGVGREGTRIFRARRRRRRPAIRAERETRTRSRPPRARESRDRLRSADHVRSCRRRPGLHHRNDHGGCE